MSEPCGMCTKISTMPNTIRASSAQEQADRQPRGPARREAHADQAGEGGDERGEARAVGQVAAQVGAEREERGRDRDEAHRLREEGAGSSAGWCPEAGVAE